MKEIISYLTNMAGEGYDLIIIDDGETPLAGSPSGANFYIVTILIFLLILLAVSVAFYIARRNRLKGRLLELRKANNVTDGNIPLSLKEIRSEISLMEANLPGSFI